MSDDLISISSIPIVDAHHHLWDLTDPDHHYKHLRHETSGDHVAGDFNRLKFNYSIKDYLQWLQTQPETNENRLPNGFVAYANLMDDQLRENLAILINQFKNVRGVRQMLNWLDSKASIYTMCDRPDYLTDDKWKKGYSLLNKYGLSFDLQIYEHQMKDAAQLAREHLDTTIILNHCGTLIS
jgi:predicted TIM-barrel fold metal-dependent hydrolase